MRFLALASCALFFSSSLFSATIRVPAEKPTIQDGIDAAVNGDTVLVADGTYVGNGNRDISFGGKNIVVKSVNGPQWTKIDCEADESEPHIGFRFEDGEGPEAIIDGFTIENGFSNRSGGGISVLRSSPTIQDCVFFSNHAAGGGGGIAFVLSQTRLKRCIFTNNSAQFGGALFIHQASPRITRCSFWFNFGIGQIDIENDSYPRMSHSLVVGGSIRVEPPNLIIPIFPSQLISNCNIHFVSGRDEGSSGGPSESISFLDVDPLLCDTSNPMYSLHPTSPCLAPNNLCGIVIGALDSICVATDVEDKNARQLPKQFSLSQNYPNPFNPSTNINFFLPSATYVTLDVFNSLGQRVVTLVDSFHESGNYTVTWDAPNISSGIYIYRLTAGDRVDMKKMLLLK